MGNYVIPLEIAHHNSLASAARIPHSCAMTPMTLDDVLAALHAVALVPTDLTVQRARHALAEAAHWPGWEVESAVRDAEVAIRAYERTAASEAAERAKVPA